MAIDERLHHSGVKERSTGAADEGKGFVEIYRSL
jgi:hypothetical protein